MMWMEYAINQAGKNFEIKGDWPGEVMGVGKGSTDKEYYLYKPGDKFIVNEDGWLIHHGNINEE